MRPTTAIASTLLLLTATLLHAQTPSQEPPPIEVRYPNVPKLLTPRTPIHAEDTPADPDHPLTAIQRAMHTGDRIIGKMLSVTLDLVVNQNGRVESAHPTAGPERFYAQAEDIALHRAYAPVRIEGNIVRARFQDYVAIYPKERWSEHPIPFPEHPDLNSLTLSLQRTACFGSCPGYTVTLSGSGDITFNSGEGGFIAVPGTHHAHIPQTAVLDLVQRFRAANFLSALDTYQCGWTDLSSQTLTLSLNGATKKVVDYGGSIVGMPDAIQALEAAVDNTTDTARWVKGNANTLSSLQSEHWNFAGVSAQNMALFNSTIGRNDPDLLHVFLTAKAPILTSDPKLVSPICSASAAGNRDLVRQLLATYPEATPNQLTLDECLSLAARSGSAPLVDLWLTHGARPTFPPRPKDMDYNDPANRINPPLLAAVQSGSPEVVALLLHRHASVASKNNNYRALPAFLIAYSNAKDDQALLQLLSMLIDAGASVIEETGQDRPAIFYASSHPTTIPLLLAAGASLDQRDAEGKTPLMRVAFSADGIDTLLKAGANPALKAPDGTTALSQARQANCTRCIDLLEAALKKRSDATPVPFVP